MRLNVEGYWQDSEEVKIIRSPFPIRSLSDRPIVSIGNFDGLHLGHQALIKQAVLEAQTLGVESVAFTFDPHPAAILREDQGYVPLFSLQDRLDRFEQLGVSSVALQLFDKPLAELSATEFLDQILFGQLNPQGIVVGADFLFGRGRQGDTQVLAEIASKYGCWVRPIEAVRVDGTRVATSGIRSLLKQGNVEAAKHLLGRPFEFCGTVVHGDGVGKQLGFPTANINASNLPVLKNGVYLTKFSIKQKTYFAVTNLGVRPTVEQVNTLRQVLEAHVLDLDQDLYGEQVKVQFLERIRDELKFSSLDQLVTQIRSDVVFARQRLQQSMQ